MNWLKQSKTRVFYLLITFFIVSISSFAGAQTKWDEGAFLGDAKFQFKFILPQDADNKLKTSANSIKNIYNKVMPKGELSSAKLLQAVNRAKNRGNVKSTLGRANKTLAELLDTAPDQNPQGYFIRAVSFLMLGKFTEALADFNSALTADPANPYVDDGAFATLSFVWKDLSDEQKSDWAALIASRMAERASLLQYKKPHDYLLIAKLFYIAADYEKAYMALDMGRELFPTDRELMLAWEHMRSKFSKK